MEAPGAPTKILDAHLLVCGESRPFYLNFKNCLPRWHAFRHHILPGSKSTGWCGKQEVQVKEEKAPPSFLSIAHMLAPCSIWVVIPH